MYTVGEDGVGLLKMDFLGLRNLTIIGETLVNIKSMRNEAIDIGKIPLDDAPTFELLSQGDTTGIFQLESAGMRRYIKELMPSSIFDLMAMVALYRPGPMQVIPEFIARKHDPQKISYPHPKLEAVLKPSYGIIAYQDDVLLTAITLAGYSWGDADKLRKAVGKKIPAEMKKQHEKFIEGCFANDIPRAKAQEIWNLIEPFAGYGFNKAHAACYAMIAYQTAFLKRHYPVEFMTAVMTAESRVATGSMREEKMTLLVEECKKMGITLLKPDINKSQVEFSIEGKRRQDWGIRFGLSAIKNVGSAAIDIILAARRKKGSFQSLRDFCSRVELGKVNKKTIESLIKSGAFDDFGKRAALLSHMPQASDEAQKEKKQAQSGQVGLFGSDDTLETQADDPLPDIAELAKPELLRFEKELLGFYLTDHPLSPQLDRIANKVSHGIGEITTSDVKSFVIIGGIIGTVKKIITKSSGQEMAFIRISDLTGSTEVVVFPKLYASSKKILNPDTVVVIKGKVDERDDRISILADTIFEQ
jgi:DNA polymerase-3 subunit alpha